MAIAIDAVTAIGFLTKLNFVGLAPGVDAWARRDGLPRCGRERRG
jgi:hypothetical protein